MTRRFKSASTTRAKVDTIVIRMDKADSLRDNVGISRDKADTIMETIH